MASSLCVSPPTCDFLRSETSNGRAYLPSRIAVQSHEMTEHYFREPNLSPSSAIRQHYVPRMLLAQFANGKRIPTYDLLEDREFNPSTNNVGLETGFYDIQIDGQVYSTENWLSDIEGQAAALIRNIAAEPSALLALSEADEIAFARFLAAQVFRVPSYRAWEEGQRSNIVGQFKDFAKTCYQRTLDERQFRDLWRIWESQPDHWWLGEERPSQPADSSTFMLGEIPGIANLLRAMPWRVGLTAPRLTLYTSDNPMSGYLPPVRPWWSGGALVEHEYYCPLSPTVVLKISPLLEISPEVRCSGVGKREYLDFSAWETSFARHVVTKAATRFLFGPGPYESKQSAESNLARISAAKLFDAMRLQGYNPRPPPLDLSEDLRNSLGTD